MDENVRKAIHERLGAEPFARKFGIQLVELRAGYARVEMMVAPDLENIFGMTHGGALFALIDAAFESACNSHGTMAVALNVNVTFVASPPPNSRLVAEASEYSRTRKTANYDIKVYDDRQELLASCQALAYRKGTPLPFLDT
jgi:acyl-CoA thioesterase